MGASGWGGGTSPISQRPPVLKSQNFLALGSYRPRSYARNSAVGLGFSEETGRGKIEGKVLFSAMLQSIIVGREPREVWVSTP